MGEAKRKGFQIKVFHGSCGLIPEKDLKEVSEIVVTDLKSKFLFPVCMYTSIYCMYELITRTSFRQLHVRKVKKEFQNNCLKCNFRVHLFFVQKANWRKVVKERIWRNKCGTFVLDVLFAFLRCSKLKTLLTAEADKTRFGTLCTSLWAG